MPKVAVYNLEGSQTGELTLSDEIFASDINKAVIHSVVRAQLANKRQGTKSTLTRTEVRGGGKKPWRQKGTGRARQGTIRAPQWAGGGTVFGPHPRSYAFKVPAKVVKLAMRSALSAKLADGELVVVDSLSFEKPSTKQAVEVLKNLGLTGRVTLVVGDEDVNTYLSFRNLNQVRTIGISEANTLDFIDNKALVFTSAALSRIEEVLA